MCYVITFNDPLFLFGNSYVQVTSVRKQIYMNLSSISSGLESVQRT